MRLSYLILPLVIFTVNIFPQNKKEITAEIKRYLKQSCKYECGVYELRNPKIIDTILVDSYNLFEYSYSSPRYRIECIDTLNKYLTLYAKGKKTDNSLVLYYVTNPEVDDAPYFPMLIVDNTYGVLFSLWNEKKYAAFNLVLELLPELKLKTDIEVREYIDFILRLYLTDDIGPYRINKPEDIWLYPRYHNYKYRDIFKGLSATEYWPLAFEVFNKDMLVERVGYDEENMAKLKTFKNYKSSIDTLRKLIKPIKIAFRSGTIQAETFIAHKYTGDIEFWRIKLNNRGNILDVQRKTILKNAGFDMSDLWIH